MPHRTIQPLRLTDDALMRPSGWERRWMFLPIVGWFIASMLHVERIQLARIEVRKQLALRPQFPSDEWNAKGVPAEGAETVCKLIAPCFAMPNHFFVPEDPNELLFLDQDSGGPIDVTMKIESGMGGMLRGKLGLYDGVLADFVRKVYSSEVAS